MAANSPKEQCLHQWAAIGEPGDPRICLKCGENDVPTSNQHALPWPDPTPEMLKDPQFEAIWQVIKRWDISVPGVYIGYCGAMGNHVRAILDGLRSADETQPAASNQRIDIAPTDPAYWRTLYEREKEEVERLRPMAESWESYEAAQERKAEMRPVETTVALPACDCDPDFGCKDRDPRRFRCQAQELERTLTMEQVASDAREPPYRVRSFWSPDKRHLITACCSVNDITVLDDNANIWEATGPEADITRTDCSPLEPESTQPPDSRGDAALWVLAWLALKGGLGSDVHDVIDAVMEGRAEMRPNNKLHIEPRIAVKATGVIDGD